MLSKTLLSSTFALAFGLVAAGAGAQQMGGQQSYGQPGVQQGIDQSQGCGGSGQQPCSQQGFQGQSQQGQSGGMMGQSFQGNQGSQGFTGGQGFTGSTIEQGPGQSAPVPQYWIADASLFIANAANTATVLSREQTLSIQEPNILGNQAQFLVEASQRSLDSLNELLLNANATNPQAVPPIRVAVAELVAAQAQASAVVSAASQGVLGPTYEVTVRSALGHLQNAERAMSDIASAYQVGDLGALNIRAGRRLR